MPVVTADVGPVYDLLLATRDGSTLACRNKDGQAVNVSQLAFMTTVDRNQVQHEETELAHKERITQLGSPNLIDREFTNWPQVTQGDWSGGMLQRVFTGATPLSGGVPSDPTRYWDGQGVLWPTTDFSLQGGLALPALVDTADTAFTPAVGPAYGFVNGAQQLLFIEHDITAAKWFLVAYDTNNTRTTLDITTQSANGWLDLFVFNNWAYLVDTAGTGNVFFASTTGGLGINTLTTFPANASSALAGAAFGIAGNRNYIAFPTIGPTSANTVRVYDVTAASGANPVGTSVNPLSFDSVVFISALQFLGDNLMVAVGDGAAISIIQYNIPSQTFSRVASIPGNAARMVSIAGSLFILASPFSTSIAPTTVEMYLLQGGSLQDIGPLTVQLTNGSTAFIKSVMKPVAFGPYAIFGVGVIDLSGNAFTVFFAYDVIRGRLFKLSQIQNSTIVDISILDNLRFALETGFSRPFQGSQRQGSWGVAYAVRAPQGTSIPILQEVLVGVQNQSGPLSPVIQQGVSVLSSIIDFTSASPKLYRQVVAKFTALPNDANITLKIDAWLDQDVASLNAAPDFTSTLTGGASTVGATKFALPINKMATKLVYRVTTTGGTTISSGSNLQPAVKLISVVVQAATGWTRTMALDLGDNAMTNAKSPGETAWVRQSAPGAPAIDGTVAYNFLRQLWRLKGGEVSATFPNGDATADWLLEDMHWDSPKPFGVSFRADQRSSLGYVCTLKMREDI